jgi:hypothetical protein
VRRVYVAGPFTPGPTTTTAGNVAEAIRVADELLGLGYAPYIPHLDFLWNLVRPRAYEERLALDFVWIIVCDALLRFPGESPGADREVEVARRLGIPVYFSIEELLEGMPLSEEDSILEMKRELEAVELERGEMDLLDPDPDS